MLNKRKYIIISIIGAALLLAGGITWAYYTNQLSAPKSISFSVVNSPIPSATSVSTDTPKPSNSPGVNLPAEKGSKLPILMYHTIDDNVWGLRRLFVSVSTFESQMKYLYQNAYNTLSFEDIDNYDKYRKPIIITFDDGYEDVYTNAYPILKKYRLKATVFLISSSIGKPHMLSAPEIKEMADIISFQSHTVNHLELDKLSNEKLIEELSVSKQRIEELTGKPVIAICYPVGKYNTNVEKLASKYYLYGLTTKSGFYYKQSDKFAIKRLRIQNISINEFSSLIK